MIEKTLKDKNGRLICNQIPYSGIRKVIGTRMRESLDVAPQGSIFSHADATPIIDLRNKLKAEGHKVTYTDIFMKLVEASIKEIPIVNSSLDIDNNVINVFETVNLGIATIFNEILVVPVIYDVQNKDLLTIANEYNEIKENLKEGRLGQIPMTGATMTVNNLGIFNIEGATPFLNIPETCMFCFGAIRKSPWVDEEGNLTVRPVITLSGTNDHRVYDGGQLAQFLTIIQEKMKDPEKYCF